MCEISDSAIHVAAGEVVGAMSDSVVRDLLENLIVDMFHNCGDPTDATLMTLLESCLVSDAPSAYYKVDRNAVRPVLAAAALAFNMRPGGPPQPDSIAQLARCAATGKVFTAPI